MADSPAAEWIIDEALTRALVRSIAPDLAGLPLTRVAEGWDNVTWRLGDDFAVRLPRRALAVPLIHHEQRALPLLAPRLAAVGILTPLPIVSGSPTPEFPRPWSIVPWLSGRPALGRSRFENTAWAEHLATALLALHRSAPADAPVNPARGVPLAHRDDSIRARLTEISADLARPLEQVWQTGLDAPPAAESVWVHGDLHPGNILVDGEGLSALIDFGDVTAGDPAYDLAVAWLAFDRDGRRRFQGATQNRYDDATWARARAWAAAVAVILAHASDDRAEFHLLGTETAAELLSG